MSTERLSGYCWVEFVYANTVLVDVNVIQAIGLFISLICIIF